MAKQSYSHELPIYFTVTNQMLHEALALVFADKKLPWPTNVERYTARQLEDSAYTVLREMNGANLNSLLGDMIAETGVNLFTLADWLRDLGGVPDEVRDELRAGKPSSLVGSVMGKVLKDLQGDKWDALEKRLNTGKWPPLFESSNEGVKAAATKQAAGMRKKPSAKSDKSITRVDDDLNAMQRIAQSIETLNAFLYKNPDLESKMDKYQDVVGATLDAYGADLTTTEKQVINGVPMITFRFKPLKQDYLQDDLNEELRVMFLNKAHVTIDASYVEIVLRTRKASTDKVDRKSAKKAPKKTRKTYTPPAPIKTKSGSPGTAFPFPTSENHPKTGSIN